MGLRRLVAVIALAVYLIVARLGGSGWGRALRAVRDHEDAAATVGLNPAGLRMQVFVLGGVITGLSGGLLVEFIAAWSPAAWGYAETFAVFTGVILGGVGNNWGVVLGTLLVQVIFLQVPTFLPQVGLHRAHRRAAVGADRLPVAGLPRNPPPGRPPRAPLPRRTCRRRGPLHPR